MLPECIIICLSNNRNNNILKCLLHPNVYNKINNNYYVHYYIYIYLFMNNKSPEARPNTPYSWCVQNERDERASSFHRVPTPTGKRRRHSDARSGRNKSTPGQKRRILINTAKNLSWRCLARYTRTEWERRNSTEKRLPPPPGTQIEPYNISTFIYNACTFSTDCNQYSN